MFAGLQLALLAFWAVESTIPARRIRLTTSALSFIVSLLFLPLSSLEHCRSLKPSLLLNAYLFTTFLLDAATLRTLWLSSLNLAIKAVFTASFISKFMLMILEGFEKRSYFMSEYQNIGPEESSGMYGQGILWWLHGIIMLGSRQVLKPVDMYPISRDMAAEELGTSFWKIWTSRSSALAKSPTESQREHHNLATVLFHVLRRPVLMPVLPRLILIGFTFCQALLLKRLLGYLSNPAEQHDFRIGVGLVGAYAITYLGIAVRIHFLSFQMQQ